MKMNQEPRKTKREGGGQPMAVAAALPYPPVEVAGPSRQYARLVQQDYAYSKGEMTAIYQYLYQHWLLKGTHPALADTLLRIAGVEMRHLDMLGSLTVLLGGDPRCQAAQGNRYTYWSGGAVHYDRALARMLVDNIRSEQDAYDVYTAQAAYVRDPALAAVLGRLAQDEFVHLQIFKEALEALGPAGGNQGGGMGK